MSPIPPTAVGGSQQNRMSNTTNSNNSSGLLKRAHTFSHSNTLPTTNTTSNQKCVWTISSLRPSPPIIPSLDKQTSLLLHHDRRKPTTFEEDALILKVIEAYCSSPKARNTVSSGNNVFRYF